MNESRINLETHQGSPLPLSGLSGYLSPKRTSLGSGSPQGHTHAYKHTHTAHTRRKTSRPEAEPGLRPGLQVSSAASRGRGGQGTLSPLPAGRDHLRKLSANWWQSSSSFGSRPPGSFTPVFRSTHQHLPRCPSRAGWHCLGWKLPLRSQLGMGMV